MTNIKTNRDGFDELIYDPNNAIVISSVSIYEFLIHFRKNIPILRDGLFFIKNNIKKIYGDPSLPFTIRDINLLLASSDDSISEKVNSYMEAKIDIEARLSSFFLGLLITQCTDVYLETNINIQTPNVLRIYRECIPANVKATQDIFILALREGYKLDKVKQVVKKQFNETIYEFLINWISFLEAVKIHPDLEIDENELSELFQKLNKENLNLKNIDNRKNNKENNSMNAWIAKFCKDSAPENSKQFTYLYKSSLESVGMPKIQIEYIDWVISKMGQNGKKFEKNDISDMLIVVVLKDSDIPLITFDEPMQDFIIKINHISKDYIEKVYIR